MSRHTGTAPWAPGVFVGPDGAGMTDTTRAPGERWQILALDTGSSMLERSMLTYTRGFGELVSVPRVMWVLRGPTTVVIDTSVPRVGSAAEFIGEDFTRTTGQDPRNALTAAGVDPHDVEFVLLTHLHWDHAGNCDLFPEATVLVQESELRYAISPGRFFQRSFLSPLGGWGVPPYIVPNLDVVKGATTIAPGLRVEPAPRSYPGLASRRRLDRSWGLRHRRRCGHDLRERRRRHPAGVPYERRRSGRIDRPVGGPG